MSRRFVSLASPPWSEIPIAEELRAQMGELHCEIIEDAATERERARLRPLLERCLPFIGREAPASLEDELQRLLADLRRELGQKEGK